MAQAKCANSAIRAPAPVAGDYPSTTPIPKGRAEVFAAFADQLPRPIPINACAADLEDRADHLDKVLNAISVYVTAILDDAAGDVPGGFDLQQIDALFSDLISDVSGTLINAVGTLPRRVS